MYIAASVMKRITARIDFITDAAIYIRALLKKNSSIKSNKI